MEWKKGGQDGHSMDIAAVQALFSFTLRERGVKNQVIKTSMTGKPEKSASMSIEHSNIEPYI